MNRQRTPRRVLIVCMMALGGCGECGSGGSIQERVPFSLSFEGNSLCPPQRPCGAEPHPAPLAIDLVPINAYAAVDISQATMNGALADPNNFAGASIDAVDYRVGPNDLNVPTPPLDIRLMYSDTPEYSGCGTNPDSVLVGTVPSVEPGDEPSGTLSTDDVDREGLREIFEWAPHRFDVHGCGDRDLEPGEMFPPQGSVHYSFTFHMTFTGDFSSGPW